MAGYDDTYKMIVSTLMGRPNGTEIQPENHQAYALNMLNYIRSLELVANGPLIGVAQPDTQPVQPDNSRAAYIAGVAQNRTVTFQNFYDYEGNPISITTGEMEAYFAVFVWNGQYWTATSVPTNIISQAENATFYYRYNIRKTYTSIANMNADKTNPIGTDGTRINIGDLVSVVNPTNGDENGIYSYEGSEEGWQFQGGINVAIKQETGQSANDVMSQKAVTDELNALRTEFQNNLSSAIDAEEEARNQAITNAINTEIDNRNDAIEATENEIRSDMNAADQQLSDAISGLQTRVETAETKIDENETAVETAQLTADEAKEIADLSLQGATERFDEITADADILSQSYSGTDGVIVYVRAKNKFAYKVILTEFNALFYANWSTADLFMNSSRTEPLKNKIYILDKYLYVFDDSGIFVKVDDWETAISVLTTKTDAILECSGILESGETTDVDGLYLQEDAKGKIRTLTLVKNGVASTVTPEIGKFYLYNELYYGYSGKELSLIGGGSGSGSGSGFFNVTKEVPLTEGFYTLSTAVEALRNADIDDEDQKLIIQYDFEETVVPTEWKAEGSELSLTKEHFKKGVQSLCWDAADKATVEIGFSDNLTVSDQNAAFFNIYSMNANNDTIYTEFLDADDEVVKRATILVNFKGWREFSRPYNEYENKANGKVKKVRFTYAAKEGDGQKIFFDNVDFNAVVDSKRQYPDMMVLDAAYLSEDNSRLLKVYAFGADIIPEKATDMEISDFNTLKLGFGRTPTGNTGKIRELLSKVSAMNIVRNSDGTVSGDVMPTPKELTLDYLNELSSDVEILAASISNQQVKTAFNNLVDHIIDQGLLYNFSGLTYSDYTNVKAIPAGFLNAMNAYTEAQKVEIIKAVKWIVEFNLAYAPLEYTLPNQSSDYIYNFLPHLYGCAANYPDQDVAIENMKALTRLLENASEYSPGSNDILKPDGTGFHHNTHYNNYMYAYRSWVEYIGKLKGTCFRINQDERIKKAVVSMYIMSTKSEDGKIQLSANSLAGRHPLVGGTEMTFTKDLFKTLVEVGGDIMGTGIDSELASQYNYFFMEDFYSGVNKADMDGFYQFNYSPAGIYRQDNWVATMRCPTTKFWGGEIYSKTNRFGRYQAHGTLEIMYDGAMENSGFPKKDNDNSTTKETGGWDWNVEAGSTTVHYTSWKEMMPNKNVTDRFDQYSKTTNFAGALAWKDCGMFGAEFDQDDSWGSQRFTPTNLTFKKSVYAFDGMLISLGSNISASGSYSDDMITATNLFQGIDSDVSGDLIINGETMPAGAEAKTNDSSADLWMLTPQGTGYFVPKGNDPIVIKHGEQESPNETGDNVDSPVTVTAAKAYIDHGVKTSDKKYVFVAVPATNTTDMTQLAAKMANNGGEIFEIKAQNEKLHALTYKPANVTAYSIFTAMSDLNFGCVKSTGSEMLLMEKLDTEKKTLSLAVANPNLRPKDDETYGWVATPTETNIVVDGEWVLSQDVDGVVVTPQSDNTTMITLTLAEGEPVYIELIDKDAVGIGNVEQSVQTKVYTAGNDVFVVNAVGTAVVYDVAGQAVKTVDVDGTARFTLEQQGCYIVKINDKTEKVMIR